MSVHLELRLEGHAADGARGRRVHALVHGLDVHIHAAAGERGQSGLGHDHRTFSSHCK